MSTGRTENFMISVSETPFVFFEFDSQSQRPTDGYIFTCTCSDTDRDVFVTIKQRVCRWGEEKQTERSASCLQQVSGTEFEHQFHISA
jgi:hypothetical protein